MIKKYEKEIRENATFYSVKFEDTVAFRATLKIHAQKELSKLQMSEHTEEELNDLLKEELILRIYDYLYSDIEKFIHELKVLFYYEMGNIYMNHSYFKEFYKEKVDVLIDEFLENK
jgi:hypothetical protein